MSRKQHWEEVYKTKQATDVSWYRPHLESSLSLIREAAVGPDAQIIDIGGGASTLVDDLLAGYRHLTVLDIAEEALADAKTRLKDKAEAVTWIAADVTRADLPENAYDLWHDRAVFHFLTDKADRERYVDAAARSVKPGGYVVMATFGPSGPTKCSGLDVVRYSAAQLGETFGSRFKMVKYQQEDHLTPSGKTQQFLYCLLQHNP